ncbi:hypothetical protein HPB49_006913 [Dermacentor silvarum]|uniref:Uncharacterized protein n=1 Tax=Dermacentor silvarum TaxID=543639 RepID=A0ACB8CVN8_DERSI|nr:hypothetical protein HPB49_006913 [Dermacentor silvarum]
MAMFEMRLRLPNRTGQREACPRLYTTESRHPRRYVLLALCCMVFLQGFVANGLVYMVLPTLERRFELKSLEAGTIVAMYHLASCISAPLVTLVAARRSKPFYLAMSAVVIGIGTMVIVLPHFMTPHYMYGRRFHETLFYRLRLHQHERSAVYISRGTMTMGRSSGRPTVFDDG